MNQHEELIRSFEKKLRRLFSEFRVLKKENEHLKSELENEHERLVRAHGELLELRKKNDHLSLANNISGSEEDRLAARKQIDKMVREIDKCLALLDE